MPFGHNSRKRLWTGWRRFPALQRIRPPPNSPPSSTKTKELEIVNQLRFCCFTFVLFGKVSAYAPPVKNPVTTQNYTHNLHIEAEFRLEKLNDEFDWFLKSKDTELCPLEESEDAASLSFRKQTLRELTNTKSVYEKFTSSLKYFPML